MLVDGSTMFDDFGADGFGSCYLGVFANTGSEEEDKTIYAGVTYLKKFYTYFDMSNCLIESNCNYL